jgi:hypothetical protein
MKMYEGGNIETLVFLTTALVGGEWSASRPGRFTTKKSPWYPLDRRLGGIKRRYRRHGETKIFLHSSGLKLQPLGHPAHSKSLYQLHYPSSLMSYIFWNMTLHSPLNVNQQQVPSSAPLAICFMLVFLACLILRPRKPKPKFPPKYR